MSESTLSHAILVLKLESLHAVRRYLPTITSATKRTTERLVIILFSDLFNADSELSHTGSWDEVQALLSTVYVEAARVAQETGRVLMDVDVLLRGFDTEVSIAQGDGWQGVFRVQGDLTTDYPLPRWATELRIYTLEASVAAPPEIPSASTSKKVTASQPSTFPVIALGGTFDHLHSGHKILLSMAAWIAHQKLIVGITVDKLLQKKANKEVLEPLDIRIERTRKFLEFFKPGLLYDLVPIDDVYGPTATDSNIQALVVSKETMSGASAIAKHRREKDLPPLECFVVDVISATSTNLDSEDMEKLRQTKMSSTFIREYIASHRSKS